MCRLEGDDCTKAVLLTYFGTSLGIRPYCVCFSPVTLFDPVASFLPFHGLLSVTILYRIILTWPVPSAIFSRFYEVKEMMDGMG